MKIKKRVILIAAVVLVIIGIGSYNVVAKTFPKFRGVSVTTVRSGNLNSTWTSSGTIEANAKQEISLDPTQKVIDVFVAKGQVVKKGDVLIKLDSTDAQHNLNVENINLESAQRELNNLINSTGDKKDAALAVTQREIELQSLKEDYDDANVKLTQDKTFLNGGFISQAEYDASAKMVQKLKSDISLKEMQLQQSKDALKDFDVNRAEQIFKLKNNIKMIEENINSIKSKVDLGSTATIDGVVVKADLEKNQYPQSQSPQIMIYDLSKYIINVFVAQEDAIYLKAGDKVKISIKGLGTDDYLGTLLSVDDMAVSSVNGSKSPLVNIKIGIDKPNEFVKVGYEVGVTFDVNKRLDVVTVRCDSIITDEKGNHFVYVVKDNVAKKKLVKIGLETDTLVEIIDGLIPGDNYVINPSERIQQADSVKIRGYEVK